MDTIENLRRTQTDILRVFTEFCKRESLAYFAMFGTMIGAVRHGGFIPWDDDIDVAMPRADYDRLCAMADKFAAPYFLQTPENDPGASLRIAHLMDLRTTYFPDWYPNGVVRGGRLGCRIDILPLDAVYDKRAAKKLADRAERNWKYRVGRAALLEMPFGEMPDWKQLQCRMPRPKSYAELIRDYHKLCTRYSRKKAKYYTIVPLRGDHRALLLPKRCFKNYIETDFDGLTIRVPKGHAELCGIIYENGAELPELSDREPKHKAFFDTKNPYTKYTPRYERVFDGLQGKKILLFGAGNMLNIYMDKYGAEYPPVCTFDNDPGKWGKIICGVEVKDPRKVPEMMDEDTRMIIISVYHKEMGKQLEGMGVRDYRAYIDGWRYFC